MSRAIEPNRAEDTSDGPDGHGTHIAGAMVGQLADAEAQTLGVSKNLGIAPAARLVVVDVEKSSAPGEYKACPGSVSGARGWQKIVSWQKLRSTGLGFVVLDTLNVSMPAMQSLWPVGDACDWIMPNCSKQLGPLCR